MNIFPAIDLYEGKAVRLFKGDYQQMTVYSEDPASIAEEFAACGAQYIHVVDLKGAKEGTTPDFDTVREIVRRSGLKVEIGGGIRDAQTVERYLEAGVMRVILGTAALEQPEFLADMVARYGEAIAVGVDMKDGYVAVKGWTETSGVTGFDFCRKLRELGVRTVICTDISKDGAMAGTNRELYREMSREFDMDIVASGGVSSLEDVIALRDMGLYGAIIGKAYYTGAIDLKQAIEVCK